MARDIFGNQKVIKIDKHSRSKYSDSDIKVVDKSNRWYFYWNIYHYLIEKIDFNYEMS